VEAICFYGDGAPPQERTQDHPPGHLILPRFHLAQSIQGTCPEPHKRGELWKAIEGFFLIRLFQQAARSSGGAISFSITVQPATLLAIVVISTVASLLASVSPARQARKLVPIEVIRNG